MSAELDPVIHPTHRLRICAMLVAGTTLELSVVKDHLELSPSALSKQVAALVEAGYVKQERLGTDSRRVWLSLTRQGLKAYRNHVAALQEIVATTTAPTADAAL
ncbi:DNA-binding MarR family transcriptional regulator [Kineococcus radiotolerans]|uniref:Transcriptional regulator, MarR family n=2 Tax=Kineococcus radiotolerans TaxID=131568 RepID=A6WFU7_KINRD|nr:transcriptional regulator [Kineococcus radiotolerans]ABS05686.1 transcriptional regulator, MarR family [Kineococcus radiotolerans SRS30216 = ATCC BAA-149]MBB2902569.1 DNA-binding MarR family transcriptional regulator [Kineococcus radiotolerans]